jgi:hypothetical protein
MPAAFSAFWRLTSPLRSMHAVMKSTPWSFTACTMAEMSFAEKPNARLVSVNANGKFHFSKLLLMLFAQSADCGDEPYPNAAAFFAPTCWAMNTGVRFGQVMQRFEPFSPNRFGPSSHWSWMFHPKVGTPLSTRYFAPAKVWVTIGATANALSSSTQARTAWMFFESRVWSSYLPTSFSCLPKTPPFLLTSAK